MNKVLLVVWGFFVFGLVVWFFFFSLNLLSSVLERAGRLIFNMKSTRKLGALCYSSLNVASTEQNSTAFIIWEQAEVADSRIKMTTAAPPINNTQFSVNMTTKSQEQSLYQSSGAIVAAIVVGVIIIFTVVLLILKTYNRRMRVKRELEPKTTKPAMPPALGQNSNSLSQHPTVTFIPVDIHMQSR
ncbi:noncompact myelin-associated protein isoform X1 [Larus michahellis]